MPQVTERQRFEHARPCPVRTFQWADGTCLVVPIYLCSHYSNCRIAADASRGEAGSRPKDQTNALRNGRIVLMRETFAHHNHWLILTIALACLFPILGLAQNNDINRAELRNFDQFLDAHPQIKAELSRNPSLVNNREYVEKHQDLRAFLDGHPGVREELRENPGIFMRREAGYERAEDRRGGGEYQPHMRAALEHLRQAESELQAATHDKGGHRVRAMDLIHQSESEIQAGIQYDNQHPDR
jgi:hypothetical protein